MVGAHLLEKLSHRGRIELEDSERLARRQEVVDAFVVEVEFFEDEDGGTLGHDEAVGQNLQNNQVTTEVDCCCCLQGIQMFQKKKKHIFPQII